MRIIAKDEVRKRRVKGGKLRKHKFRQHAVIYSDESRWRSSFGGPSTTATR